MEALVRLRKLNAPIAVSIDVSALLPLPQPLHAPGCAGQSLRPTAYGRRLRRCLFALAPGDDFQKGEQLCDVEVTWQHGTTILPRRLLRRRLSSTSTLDPRAFREHSR